MGAELVDRYVFFRFFPFNNIRVGKTKEQIFVCDFTLEKGHPSRVRVFLLGEGMEVVPSKQDRDPTRVGQLAVSCAHPPLIQHYN